MITSPPYLHQHVGGFGSSRTEWPPSTHYPFLPVSQVSSERVSLSCPHSKSVTIQASEANPCSSTVCQK